MEDIEFLKELIRIPSVSDCVAEVNRAVDLVSGRLAQEGLTCWEEVTEDARKAVFVSTDGTKRPDVLLAVHVDVVPAQRPDQFEPREEDGRICGRGAWDCKGHCLLALRLLRRLKNRVSVGCAFSSDEEICGISAGVLLDRGYGARRLVVVLDSVPYALTTSQKGSAKYAHKAEPVILDETEPRLLEFRDCMREKWPGRRIGFCSINGFTDAHHYRRLGLPMLIIGVEGEGSHEANESVRLDSLSEYEDLLADYLLCRFAR